MSALGGTLKPECNSCYIQSLMIKRQLIDEHHAGDNDSPAAPWPRLVIKQYTISRDRPDKSSMKSKGGIYSNTPPTWKIMENA